MEKFLFFWATPKEVASGWYVYLGIMVLMSVPLVINLKFSNDNKKLLIQVLALSTLTGFFVLMLTDVGLSWPALISVNRAEIKAEVLAGEKIFFKYGCPNCHQIGSFSGAKTGPNLEGVSARKNSEALITLFDEEIPSRLHSIMPDYKKIMKPEELKLLLKFLDYL